MSYPKLKVVSDAGDTFIAQLREQSGPTRAKVEAPSRKYPSLTIRAVLAVLQAHAALALARVLNHLGDDGQDQGVHLRTLILRDGIGGPDDLVELNQSWIAGGTKHFFAKNFGEIRRYQMFTVEKALRLAEWVRKDAATLSSFQAGRDRALDHYAGAIRVLCRVPYQDLMPDTQEEPVWLVFSVSGLGELEDEAVAVALARELPWQADEAQLQQIVEASSNQLAARILAQRY